MYTLFVFHEQTYYSIKLTKNSSITIGPEFGDNITLSSFPSSILVKVGEDDRAIYRIGSTETVMGTEKFYQLSLESQSLTLFMTSRKKLEKTYYIGNQSEVVCMVEPVSKDEECHFEKKSIYIKKAHMQHGAKGLSLIKNQKYWEIISRDSTVYLNGHLVLDKQKLEVGDILFWNGIYVTLMDQDVIQIESFYEFESSLKEISLPQSEMMKRYPNYRRTPRMLYELPKEKVQLSFPGQESMQSKRSLWLIILPPLVMMIVMGLVALLIPRGIFILISIVMFSMTIITSTIQYFKEKTSRKEQEERRKRVYSNYLEEKRRELESLASKQRQVLEFHFPSFERMKYLTEQISDRIWERSIDSKDFLQFRLGTGDVPASYQISVNSADLSNREMDELLERSKHLQKTYQHVKNLPITADLSKGSIGLIGKMSVLKGELHQIIGQLAFFHSYHDVRFLFIFHEEEYKYWEWMKWLPHFQIPQSFAKGFIYNEQTRDQLLSSIYELIRERDVDETDEKTRFAPHFVFIVTNQELLAEHVILEYLEGSYSHLGISAIFAGEAKESFSNNIHTLIRYVNGRQGDILIQNKAAVQIPFNLDNHALNGNEEYARMLKTLNHQVGVTNSIPETVSFMEMLKAKDVDEIPIKENWLTNESAKTLAAPIGLKGKSDIVYLNLHEKAHGPHGLLAGTTGSGKSELLQTYILSLAVHYHPHEVAFLLIDYKGGGMAQPFRNMPHLLGTITNIEGSRNFSNRALASIKSELKRRQRLFDKYVVNHINDYTSMYKRGEIEEPLPHLFLISDEFAELKSEEPDFIKELVSAARIGRSLGVHLILATQKPGGVIDSQIWSNARFRIALKVQNAEDSREILKNSDAASLTITGRGYLQVGNNEVYELFQSAWSGANYQEDTSQMEDEIAIVSDLGLIPLSELSVQEKTKVQASSEIDVIVGKIEELQKELQLTKLSSPWLPPLSPRIYRPDYQPDENYRKINLAMIDDPEAQSQSIYPYTLLEDGNVGVFGTSGYGKTQSLITLLMGIAENYSPEEVHFYLMDFGNGGLMPLKQLPHVGELFLMDEQQKINKFMAILQNEINLRKQLFQQTEVSSISMYNQLNDETLPVWFIVIDNYDIVKDEMADLEAQINQFARDGQSLGIYMFFGATRVSSIRPSLMNNLKTKIVHYLMDHTEAYSILGRIPYEPEPIPGRAIIKKEGTYFTQILLSCIGDNDFDQLTELKASIQNLREKYESCRTPQRVPMLPKELTNISFKEYIKEETSVGLLPIGLDEESVQPVFVDFHAMNHFMILGQAQKGKTNVIKLLINHAIQQGMEGIGIWDSINRGLAYLAEDDRVQYLTDRGTVAKWLESTEAMLLERNRQYDKAILEGKALPIFTPLLFVVDGYGRLLQEIDNRMQEMIVRLMKNYSHLGFQIVVSGSTNELTKGYDPLTLEIKQIRQALLLMKKSEQSLYTLSYERKEPEIQPGYGYYVKNGLERKIQIPLVLMERKVYS